jgi:hypothetical protein
MWQALIPLIGTVIDKVLPDETANLQAKAELIKMQQQGELQLLLGQQEINKAEAQNASVFVAGWRPAIGWICGTALAYQFLALPILTWYSIANGIPAPPDLATDYLFELVAAMLGIAGLRSYEKVKGVTR